MKHRTEEMEPAEKLAADERIAKLLGVIDPGMDMLATTYRLLEDQVGGFYDPPSKTFYLMESMPKGLAGSILSHELVHALDDQLYDLDDDAQALDENSDAALAYHCVVEGSGMVGMMQWTMRHAESIDLSGSDDLMSAQMESLQGAPEWLWKPIVASYFQGQIFLARATGLIAAQSKPVPGSDIQRAFRDPPRSTEQVLHPEKYWDPERLDLPRGVALEIGELPEGWKVRRQDTLGEMLLALVATPSSARGKVDLSNPFSILGLGFTSDVAAGWGGDRLVLLEGPAASWLRLATVWDSEREASEFYGAMSVLLPELESTAKALAGQAEGRTRSGAELSYGSEPDQVVLTVWTGSPRSDLRALDRAVKLVVGSSTQPAPGRSGR